MPSLWIHVPLHPPRRIGPDLPVLTVGRTPDNGLVLNDPAISRSHARLTWEDGTVWLQDLGSRHGTFVNGTRLQERRSVGLGDEIRLGPLPLRLEADTLPTQPMPVSALQTQTVALAELRARTDAQTSADLDLVHTLSVDLVGEVAPDAMVHQLLTRLGQRLSARTATALLRDATGCVRVLDAQGAEVPAPTELTADLVDAAFQRHQASLVLGEGSGTTTASSMTVPLEHQGEVFGLLHFRSSSGHTYQSQDLRLVATLGNLLAARLLHQQAVDEVQRRKELERDLELREAATRARATFLSTLSHELRSPLQALLSYNSLALSDPRPERLTGYLRRAEQAGQHLKELVNNILDFSRIEEGRLTLEAVPFRLLDVLDTVEAMFIPQAEAKGLRLEWYLDSDVPHHLQGDPLRLGQVLINLVGNAVKFTERGAVELAVTLEDEHTLAFDVADSGVGISKEAQARIFDPYQQAGTDTARAFGGTGLGLAISRQLVSLMGGVLTVESAPGIGSTFRFTLPLRPSLEVEPLNLEATDRLAGRVLVVEDSAVNRSLLVQILRGAGAEVAEAVTVGEALAVLGQMGVQVVLTDLNLPDGDGLALARELKARPELAHLPVVLLTGQDDPETEAQCRALGIQAYLLKPVTPDQLVRTLRPWLARTAPMPTLPDWEDHTLFLELGRLFLANHGPALTDVTDLLHRGELGAASALCHSLKSACGALHVEEATGAWAALEAAVASGCCWEAALDRVETVHTTLVSELRARLH